MAGLGRKVDGNALQNAELMVQVEDLRKYIKDNSTSTYNEWELLEVIPVKSDIELIDLGTRITNDQEFRMQMVGDQIFRPFTINF